MINMFDLETLGTDTETAPILSCAAITVDETRFVSDTPYTFIELVGLCSEIKLNVREQIEVYGRKIDKATFDWWSRQSAESKTILVPHISDRPIAELVPWMVDNFTTGSRVYTRGNSFDPPLISSVCKMLKIVEPYKFWDIRDTRTFLDAVVLQVGNGDFDCSFVPKELEKEFIKHDAVHDIAMDIYRIQFIIRLAQGK